MASPWVNPSAFDTVELVLTSVRPEMVNLARVRGGQRIQTGGILLYFEDLNLLPNEEIG
jgi:hypothetical protein